MLKTPFKRIGVFSCFPPFSSVFESITDSFMSVNKWMKNLVIGIMNYVMMVMTENLWLLEMTDCIGF